MKKDEAEKLVRDLNESVETQKSKFVGKALVANASRPTLMCRCSRGLTGWFSRITLRSTLYGSGLLRLSTLGGLKANPTWGSHLVYPVPFVSFV